jgi:putative thiamine transport system substrate-binding protein
VAVPVHRAHFGALLLLCFLPFKSALAADPDPTKWQEVLVAAKGQTVSFNAWGGEPRINAYIAWAGAEVEKRYGVTVNHVKLADTAEAVQRVLADKTAGANEGGAIDLIWINGENFAAMKKHGLLFGPWANATPSFPLTDPERHKDINADFTVPVDGLESPWGRAQVVFYHDVAELAVPPRSMMALLAWCKANPGRFAYPRPPDFLGSTFLKQVLLEVATDKPALYSPVDRADFAAVTKPLWDFLDRLHPALWRQGRAFPANSTELRRLFADKETRIGFTFNPGDPSAAVANNEFPTTVNSYVLDGGTIGNVHFLAIPFNAANKAGAMVLADFLLSPEAQARKLDPAVWGDQTVLNVALLADQDKVLFDRLDLGSAALRPEALGIPIPEPHPSWVAAIEAAWAERYAAQ